VILTRPDQHRRLRAARDAGARRTVPWVSLPAPEIGATFRLTRTTEPVLTVVGELDVTTAPALRANLDQLVSGGQGLVGLDLAGVTFMDSSGVHVLVDAALAHPGRLRLADRSTAVDRVLALTGVDDLFS
jgi:anti-sigma B factor antagonist